jgi:hypothetical protein
MSTPILLHRAGRPELVGYRLDSGLKKMMDMRRKFTVLLLFCLAILGNAMAQNSSPGVCEGDVYLTSQADVNNFNCTEITGSLSINGEDITDLSPLQNLTKVGMLHILQCPNLENVDGLAGLRQITKREGYPYVVGISGNDKLKNLDGLSHFTGSSLGNTNISYNPMLETINAFTSVDTVFGLFAITNNASLKSMDGFGHVTTLTNWGFEPYLFIDSNPSLENLNGFSAISRVDGNGGTVEISNNEKLTDLGLSSLEYIIGGGRGAGIFIHHNAQLRTLDGLPSLKAIGYGVAGAITITDNQLLEDIDAISTVDISSISVNFRFTLSRNPSLKNCSSVYALMENLGLEYVNSSSFVISENGSGCTLEDILANGPPAVTGYSIFNTAIGVVERDFYNDSGYIDIAISNSDQRLQANTQNASKIGSLAFLINGKIAFVDNQAPYHYDFSSLPAGTHAIATDIYSEPNAQGTKTAGKSATFIRTNSAAVESFDVVDTQGNVVLQLTEGARINIRHPYYRNINIRANTYPYAVNNVKFYLNKKLHRTETVVPYALNGDTDGTFYTWNPKPGKYTLRAVPAVKPGATEFAGQPLEIHFTIYEGPVNSVQSFSIVNTSGEIIKALNNGDVLNINDPSLKSFGVIANTAGLVGSVKFRLDNNQNYRTENVAPYALTGDENGHFNPWTPTLGRHTLTATPYLLANAQDDAGTPLRISFTVVKEKPASVRHSGIAVALYPVPVKDDLFINIQNVVDGNVSVVLRNSVGHAVYQGSYGVHQSQPFSINTSGLSPGVYFLQLRGANGFEKVIRVVK